MEQRPARCRVKCDMAIKKYNSSVWLLQQDLTASARQLRHSMKHCITRVVHRMNEIWSQSDTYRMCSAAAVSVAALTCAC